LKRKLHLLNLALAALVALAGWRIWQIHERARIRSEAVLGQTVQPAPALPAPVLQPPQPASAIGYIDIAQNLLFSRDRNPTVEVAVVEKPLPPLPVAHGVLDLGSGPTAILSEASGKEQRAYRVGDQIGEFKLVLATPTALEFEWETKRIRKTMEELKPEETVEAAPPPPQAAQPPPQAQSSVVGTSASKAAPSEIEMGTGLRACQQDDTSPPGTVSGGYRKVVTETPFGKACRWELIK
jgi:hypothetical protein